MRISDWSSDVFSSDLRARLADDLARRTLCSERVVAAVVRLLDLAALRIGNEQYVAANKSFGATTLRQRHAKASGKTLRLQYVAKGGAKRDVTISDRSLSTLVRDRKSKRLNSSH